MCKAYYPHTFQLIVRPVPHGHRLRNVRGFVFFTEDKRVALGKAL